MEYRNSVRICVSLKHMGNIAKKVKPYPFFLENTPSTLRGLITESVRACIRAYEARAKDAECPQPLTDEQFAGMREVGKFAFGVHYNDKAVNEEKAVETALMAFSDGLVRIFKENEELTELDGAISVKEGDCFTFVRLTMLTGTLF